MSTILYVVIGVLFAGAMLLYAYWPLPDEEDEWGEFEDRYKPY